jgi:hypothetical protein
VATNDRISRRLKRLLSRLTPAAGDAAAAELGYEIQRGPWGRRTYRDLRFFARRAIALAELEVAQAASRAANAPPRQRTRPTRGRTMTAARAALLLRWRTEVTLVTLAIIAAHVFTVSGTSHRTTLIRALITASVLMAQRETRAWVIDRAHCLLTRRRLYAALEGVQADVGAPQLPLVLWVRPSPLGERAYLWRRPGITPEMLHTRANEVAANCWAKEALFSRNPRWPNVITVDVVRRPRQSPRADPARGDWEERHAAAAASRQ